MKLSVSNRFCLALIAVATSLAVSAIAAVPPAANVLGADLAAWTDLYFRWFYNTVSIPPGENGNAVVRGNVVLMPLPNTSGDGTPGSVDVTLKPGQKFVLPIWTLQGNRYDETTSDPLVDRHVLETVNLAVTIDGVTIVDGGNMMDYYSEFFFTPEISPANSFPFIWFQGFSMVHNPLTPGTHVITIDAFNTVPIYDQYVFEYHNTFNVTVKPGR